jgi:tRNA (guanine10-N2)-methyltransferase
MECLHISMSSAFSNTSSLFCAFVLISLRSREGYIAPKKPYGFEAMMNDILDFAARTLVTDGRLAMWMPTANDEEVELSVPMHANLEVVSVCVQPFSSCRHTRSPYPDLP